MNSFRLSNQIIEYLISKSGKETTIPELVKKFSTNEAKPGNRIKNRKDSSQDKVSVINSLIILLETEKLISVQRKTIHVAKLFSLEGKISLSKRGDGFVKLSSGNEMFIPSKLTLSAISGDIVEILPTGIGKKNNLEGEVLKIKQRGRELYRLKVLDHDNTHIFGLLLDMTGETKEGMIAKKSLLKDTIARIKADDILIVKLREGTSQESTLYEVTFIRFEEDSKEDKDFNRILMKYNYGLYYPDNVSLDYPEEVDESSVDDWSSRQDLRDLFTVTIDGETAKDFDDAISFSEVEGKIKFHVHIADVSYYVKQFSAMDDEAYHRSTSVYLANKVIPMLPPLLSENLCSLVADKNRLAFTVEMEADFNGVISSAKFYKSVIRVDKRCTYESAEKEINSGDPGNWYSLLCKFTESLKEKRVKDGRIDLNLKETYLITDDDGKIKEIKTRERLRSHMLIEELMLSANIKVAEHLRKNKVPGLFRIHESMDEEKIETLNSFLALYGFKTRIKNTDYKELKEALKEVHGHPSERIFNYFLLRSFMQAYYSGESSGHWGLGFENYCHFTSPIRRYPDLVCHRALDALVKSEKHPYTEAEITLMGKYCSEEERKAADAERDVLKLKACRYLSATGINKFSATITGFKPQSVFVELSDLNVEGVISFQHFTDGEELVIPTVFYFVSKKVKVPSDVW
ncbi:MAG: ribonuclease R [Leptospira sp.]|nr:ribonuclease R [Leptospira sp.]